MIPQYKRPYHFEKQAHTANSVYVAIAGEVVNRRSVLLKNFVLNGKESTSIRYCTYTQTVVRHFGVDNTRMIKARYELE